MKEQVGTRCLSLECVVLVEENLEAYLLKLRGPYFINGFTIMIRLFHAQ